MKKWNVFLLGTLLILAACSPVAGSPAGTETDAPESALAASPTPTEIPEVKPPTPRAAAAIQSAGDALPDRFAACVEMEPAVELPLRWVYSDAGDLWVWDEGTEPISLTGTGDVIDFKVRPDGDRIVFTRGQPGGSETLWVSGPDGADLAAAIVSGSLTGAMAFHDFSSDGNLLAFTHMLDDRTGELWVLDLTTRTATRLVDQPTLMEIVTEELATGALPAGVTWVPGRARLTFDAYPTFDTDGIYIYVQTQVYAVNAGGGAIAEIYPVGLGGAVSYSPDGSLRLLTEPSAIKLIDIATGTEIPLTVPYRQVGFGEYYAAPALGWMRDSSAFLLTLPDENSDPYMTDHPVTIWEVPVDGSPALFLLSLRGFFASFTFSGDASKVAFWSNSLVNPDDRALHVAETHSGQHIVYAEGALIEFFGWSSFDRYFAYGDPDSGTAFIGDLCADPKPLAQYPIHLRWLDEARFVYDVFDTDAGRREVYLGGLGGESELRFNLDLESQVEVVLIGEN